MDTVAQHLECEARNLTSALDVLLKHARHNAPVLGAAHQQDASISAPRLSILPGAGPEIHEARRSLLASMSKLHWMLDEPAEFMQNLIIQSQLISCLTWMAEFQILAYIPVRESVPIGDIAELAGLPASQLARMVRMTAMAGFLCEPQPDHVAHTSLSAAFVQRLDYYDATLFLGKVTAPACLRMAEMTKRGGILEASSGNGLAHANGTPTLPLPTVLGLQNPKVQRCWSTFLQCLGDVDDSIEEVLIRLDWHSLGKATIVDTCAQSVSDVAVLAKRFPTLNFIVQSDKPIINNAATTTAAKKSPRLPLDTPSAVDNNNNNNPYLNYLDRVTSHKRSPGGPQTITDAAVYLLRVPSPSAAAGALVFNDRASLRAYLRAELTAHLGVLRANPAAKFVLSFRPLPEAQMPTSMHMHKMQAGLAQQVALDPHVEAMARARDLAKMALTNGGDLELKEVLEIVDGVRDDLGRLAVINKIQCQNSATVVVSIRYQG